MINDILTLSGVFVGGDVAGGGGVVDGGDVGGFVGETYKRMNRNEKLVETNCKELHPGTRRCTLTVTTEELGVGAFVDTLFCKMQIRK